MREHMGLYRGKRTDYGPLADSGEWARGNLLYDRENNEAFIAECFEDRAAYLRPVDPDTVGECTGLTDKNGKLIFEGDIVRESFEGSGRRYADGPYYFDADYEDYDFEGYKIGKVVFSGTGAHIISTYGELWIDGEKENYTPTRRKRLAAYRSEIIGTVHDNPELLKGGEG